MTVRIEQGDVRDKLAELADESVHCVITSPPYWGLRDYNLPPQIWGGDADCPHEWGEDQRAKRKDLRAARDSKLQSRSGTRDLVAPIDGGNFCISCNARRGSLGLEPTPDLYLEHMVGVFRDVRRVLRADGTLWLNMGDSYAGSVNGRSAADTKALTNDDRTFHDKPFSTAVGGLKPKDLCMMPARLALALQADGWWLRSEIVWAKPNPMPESITDRPTSSHEKVFLLTKSARYFYDAEAVRENTPGGWRGSEFDTGKTGVHQLGRSQSEAGRKSKKPDGWDTGAGTHGTIHREGREAGEPSEIRTGRNLRNVWNIATQPYPDAHFATFPTALVEPCIKAGTSEKGCCPECGGPWRRLTCQTRGPDRSGRVQGRGGDGIENAHGPDGRAGDRCTTSITTTGWWPSCECAGDLSLACISGAGLPILPDESIPTPCTVLDPFAGAGTTGLVADRLNRNAILIELNPEYAAMAERRLHKDAGLFAEVV